VKDDAPENKDNWCVRSLAAAVLLVMFGFLSAVDGICCPDGCTREEASTSQHNDRESSDGNCILCLGGVESPAPQTRSASGIVTDRFTPFLLTLHLDAPTEPPDHPPRS
jgi:hypothetical protein